MLATLQNIPEQNFASYFADSGTFWAYSSFDNGDHDFSKHFTVDFSALYFSLRLTIQGTFWFL